MTRLGSFLKELRGSLSTVDVERDTGIARITISRYERGENIPSPEKLKQLADFYDYPYDKLRLLQFDDLLSNPENAEILQSWLFEKYFTPLEAEIVALFRKIPTDKQAAVHQALLPILQKSSQSY